jgi:hypothetical protein
VRRAIACVLLAVTLVACTQEARPQGIVENWLRSLDQGAAGRPDRYAPEDVSQQVVPGWHDLDPGHLDTIEVFDDSSATTTQVLFRVVDVNGQVTAGTAHLEAAGDSWRITGVDMAPGDVSVGATRDHGGLPVGWPVAVAIAVGLTLLAVGSLVLVRRSASTTP